MAQQKRSKLYALCIDNGGYPESLDVRKVYPVLPDKRSEANNYIRVIDETGEDYLYPAKLLRFCRGAKTSRPGDASAQNLSKSPRELKAERS